MASESISRKVPSASNDVDDAVGVSSAGWFAAVVNSRHELKVAEKLRAMGVESFVASQREARVWSNGRRKTVDRIVIPSVVFVRCTQKQRREIVEQPFIHRFIVNRCVETGALRKPAAMIPDAEIQRLRFMLGQSDYPVSFEPAEIHVSDNVRVIRGVLAGLEGEVVAADSGAALTVLIPFLGCAKVNIEPENVEPLK